jgi:hypothetical protein
LNMNQINQGLLFIIYYLFEIYFSQFISKKSIKNLFEL